MITPAGHFCGRPRERCDRDVPSSGSTVPLVYSHRGSVVMSSGHLIHCCPQSLTPQIATRRLHSTPSRDRLAASATPVHPTPHNTRRCAAEPDRSIEFVVAPASAASAVPPLPVALIASPYVSYQSTFTVCSLQHQTRIPAQGRQSHRAIGADCRSSLRPLAL